MYIRSETVARLKLEKCRQHQKLCTRELIRFFLELETLIMLCPLSYEEIGSDRNEFIALKDITRNRGQELKDRVYSNNPQKCGGENCQCFPSKK